jgi:hypothetical protein
VPEEKARAVPRRIVTKLAQFMLTDLTQERLQSGIFANRVLAALSKRVWRGWGVGFHEWMWFVLLTQFARLKDVNRR